MARKLRLQFEGAIYHVINRGNYRRDVFESAGAAMAFEQCLFEACEQAGWRLYAYAIMRNHFHLAVETPRANLVEGMHWLQSTFATRFNRFRNERGHLFQSRYKAILVEPGPHLARVVNYIHLNPQRAGIVPVDLLAQFRWSSFRRFLRGDRPLFLECATWLRELGFDDSPAGWRGYGDHLRWLAADTEEQRRQAFEHLSKGWAIGDEGWRASLAQDLARKLQPRSLHEPDTSELRQARWNAMLDRLLAKAGRTRAEMAEAAKSESWKVALALQLKRTTMAPNAWIAQTMAMGTPGSLSVYLSAARKELRN
ncbi:MAG: transposase [Opitutaceae bacterium]|nr:transposase [Opitutaceae bacterium]